MSILLDGLSLGAIYALIALGYTMVYGIAKLLNFAHGDIIMVGAYAILCMLNLCGNVYVALVAAVVICTVMGIAVEKFAYKPLRGASPLAVLITAIGVSFLLQSVAQLVFGAKSRPVSLPSFGTFTVAGVTVNASTLITLAVGAVIMAALTLFVAKTRIGRAMQAVSEDRGAAQLMGINVNAIVSCRLCKPVLSVADSVRQPHARRNARHQGVYRGSHRRHRLHSRRNAGWCAARCD